MEVNDAGSGDTDEYVPTEVSGNVGGIADFARVVRDELEANLRPSKDQILADHSYGVGFGNRSASSDMHLAVRTYFDCLVGAESNLTMYVRATEVLVAAAGKVAAAYAKAEARSADRLATIDNALEDAARETDAAVAANARSQHRQAGDQKRALMQRDGVL